MPEIKLITPITKQTETKKRVAAYCRVSTNSADQQNSYETQMRVKDQAFFASEQTGEQL